MAAQNILHRPIMIYIAGHVADLGQFLTHARAFTVPMMIYMYLGLLSIMPFTGQRLSDRIYPVKIMRINGLKIQFIKKCC